METPKEFIQKYCYMCGSQRCERSGEWLKGCPYWRDYKWDSGVAGARARLKPERTVFDS